MIYSSVVKQYETNKGHTYQSIDESGFMLKFLQEERNNYKNLLENCIDSNQREILEAKYEVIQESVVVVIITAIIAVIGVIIKIMKSAGTVASTGTSKINEQIKKFDNKYSLNIEEAVKRSYKELSDNIEKRATGVIKRLNGGYADIINIGDIDKVSNTIVQYIQELETGNEFDQFSYINDIISYIQDLDVRLSQFDKRRLSLIDSNYYRNGNKDKLKINVPSVEDLKEVYIRYINGEPNRQELLGIKVCKRYIKQLENETKSFNENITVAGELEKRFKALQNNIKVNSDKFDMEKIDSSSFFEATLNLFKVLKNQFSACLYIVKEQILICKTSIDVITDHYKEMSKNYPDLVNNSEAR